MILNEAVDVASRKRALEFLINNYDKCFPNRPDATEEQKKQDAQSYLDEVLVQFCHPIDVLHKLSWTKALVEGLVRILKTECNDGTAKPVNKRMIAELKKVYFAATMYRQKQQWDGLPQNQWLTTNLNGWNFYKLRSVMLPFYNEAKEIHENGYGDKFLGKKKMLDIAKNADKVRADAIKAKLDNGEEVGEEDKTWYAAYLKALEEENNDGQVQPRDVDPWANTDWGGHVPYMTGKFRIGNKGYWAVRINTHEQSNTWCWWTYPNCPWDQEPNGAQWCITYNNPHHWNLYHLGGRGQVAYYVFKEGFEKLDRKEDGNIATEPYDKWGTSLICVRLSRDPEIDDSTIEGFCSRYNHFGQQGRDVAQKNGFADNFCDRGSIKRFCELVGCTKEEFCQKFRYHEVDGNQIVNGCAFDINKLYKRIDAGDDGNLNHTYRLRSLYDSKTFTNYIVTDTVTQKHNYVVNNRIVFEQWKSNISPCNEANNGTMSQYVCVNSDGEVQYYDKLGSPILPTPIASNEYCNHHFVKCNINNHTYLTIRINKGGNYYTAIYDVTAKRYISRALLQGEYYPIHDSFPYLYHGDELYKFDFKTGKVVSAQDIRNALTGRAYKCIANKNFFYNSESDIVIPKSTMEKINIHVNFIEDAAVGKTEKWVTPDGQVHLYKDIFGTERNAGADLSIGNRGIMYDGKNALIGTVSDSFIRLTRPDGEIVMNKTIENGSFFHSYINNDCSRVTEKDEDGNVLFVHAITAAGVKTIKVNPEKKSWAVAFIYINDKATPIMMNSTTIYNGDGDEILKSDAFDGNTFSDISRINGCDAPVVNLTLNNFDHYIVWVNSGKYIRQTSTIIPIGFGYLFCKTGNNAAVYDEEGRTVFTGALTLNAPFNRDGIASVSKRNGTIFFNLDNEWSTALEDLVESKKPGRMALLKEAKQIETPFDRLLRLAAYLC